MAAKSSLFGGGVKGHGSLQSRHRLLLAALFKVLQALGGVEKAIGWTDRYLNLVHLLSNLSFSQALRLIQVLLLVLLDIVGFPVGFSYKDQAEAHTNSKVFWQME